MKFYELPKSEREQLVCIISDDIADDLRKNKSQKIKKYFSDPDTYIRKAAYQSAGKSFSAEKDLRANILNVFEKLLQEENPHIRQTVINSAGEIGIKYFSEIRDLLEQGLSDEHHSVRNAVIGSLKKICEKNPAESLPFIKTYLHHPDAEIRREICHGLELRGRLHPQDILPLLKELQFEKVVRVRNTLVHVIGQIAYKKGCLEKVIEHLKTWENREVVKKSLDEIIIVHERYKNFSFMTKKEAEDYIKNHF
jgi:hypothetical protein